MTYENKYQTRLVDNFIRSVTTLSYTTVILLLTILSFIAFSAFGTMSEKGEAKTLGIIVLFSSWTVLSALWKALTFLPNEKSVTVDKNMITINFPYLKKAQSIDFNDINYIRAKDGDEKTESVISVKIKETVIGLDEDFVTISSIDSNEWRKIAKEKQLPLIIHQDVEENVKVKKGIFATTYLNGDDYYVIRKNFENEDERIELLHWQAYVRQNNWIRELGPEELINVTEKIQKGPKYQYSIDTKHGVKGLDFVDGQLIATYVKKQDPDEIQRISNDLKLSFKNVTDIK